MRNEESYIYIHLCTHVWNEQIERHIRTVKSVEMCNQCLVSVKGSYLKETFNDIYYKSKYSNSRSS